MVIKEKKLASQEPCIVREGENSDFFNIHESIEKVERLLKNGDITDGIQILGIFDGYGEGKSSLINTLKNKHKNKYCFIELDLWKYSNKDIKNDFHKVFYNEMSNYYWYDFVRNGFFQILNKFGKTKAISESMINKNFIEAKLTDDYFAYGLNVKIRKRKRKITCKKRKTIILIENMDRLTIEEKVTALSSIYNYRDSFESHIIITLDPDSVRNTTTHFESLVHKSFTAYMYITPKTKHTFEQYIIKQLGDTNNIEISKLLTEMLLTQYPISLRELNHCMNTYIMSTKEIEKTVDMIFHKLKFFMSISQVQYHQLYRAVSQNPYILKKFIHHANDTGFDGYSEYGIEDERRYKLNLLIKSLGDVEVDDNEVLSILSPLNRKFLTKEDYTLDDWIIRIEFLRKAYLEKDVIGQIEKFVHYKVLDVDDGYSFEEFNRFFTETVKDRRTFINFFQSQNFEDIFIVLKGIVYETDTISFLETILSYNLKEIDDYSFYENYSRTIKLYLEKIYLEKSFSELLVQRILENFQLTREMIEKGVVLESNEYLITKLKQLSFVNKILYITYFFPTINSTQDTNSIETVNNIIESSIRDLDIKKLENIEQYKQNIIKNFYLKDIPIGRYPYATIGLILDIIESTIFEQLHISEKIRFYDKVFNNHELIKQEDFDEVINKLSKLLDEALTIEDTEILVEIFIKVKALDMMDIISDLSLKKFIVDSLELYGKYDEGLKSKLKILKL